MESNRLGGSKTDGGFASYLSLIFEVQGFGKRGRLAFCKRQKAVKTLMAFI